MTLAERIEGDLRQAMRQKNEAEVSVLRMVKSALHNYAIAKRQKELPEDEVLKVIQSEAKKRRESIAAFTAGGRDELSAKEQAELALIERYLPQQLSEVEITQIVQECVAAVGDGAQFGTVMKAVMAKVQGRADGKAVSAAVKAALAG